MRRTLAVSRRILSQFAHDKRTLALLFVAPIVVLWLLSVLLGADAYGPRLATVNLPADFQIALEQQDARVSDVSEQEAEDLLRNNEVAAVLRMADDSTLEVWAEGSDSTKTQAAVAVVSAALNDLQKDASERMEADIADKKAEIEQAQEDAKAAQEEMKASIEQIMLALPDATKASLPSSLQDALDASSDGALSVDDLSIDPASYLPVQDVEVEYLHGNEDWKMFDFYGPVFIAIFLFAFTFITSGMSLVNERSAGTMTRFLATPIKPAEILGGYAIGFGALSLVQTAVILVVALGFIGFPNEGNLALVVFAAVSMAIASVTLGLLVSGLASTAFQVIQLMLLFVVPQILLSGLFDLSGAPGWLQALGQCFPVTYGVDALRAVMLRGAGLADVGFDLAMVWGFIVLFFVLAALGFRKKHAKPMRG
ncbi:ABC transporter permease [Gordonibacter massiliensis (ex Traore et al. 2017)]|uniref:ABC transporter permease n=1 Tax=Gordonibacter massiliensis (ex Traore et al. 2017) TaxID=1841863 RepID=UPI001C8BE745|nr:ABC transporter permease [Gordonibacter massiliensis (ex Traore et al. 2017)]MBX9033975.1 ABC transporter permease [Gordonibacter massiliensis (ex Traore et al. 2017)]